MFDESTIELARKLQAELTGGERLATMSLAHARSVEVDPAAREPSSATEEAIARSARELELLRFVTHQLHVADDTRHAAETALTAVANFIGADAASLTTLDRVRQRISVYCTYGLSAKFASHLDRWRLGDGFGGRVYTLREPVLVPDLFADGTQGRGLIVDEGLRSYVGVLLSRGSQRVGLIEFFRRTPTSFSPLDVALLELVSAAITPFIETSSLELRVKSLHDERARHFRTLVSQISGTRHRNVEHHKNRLLSLADELHIQEWVSGVSAASEVRALFTRFTQIENDSLDLLALVESGIIDRFRLEEGLSCSLTVSSWPTTLSTSLASRLYLLILRIAEDLALTAETMLGLTFSSTAEELHIDFAYDLGGRQLDSAYSPGAETVSVIEELHGSVGYHRSHGQLGVRLLVPRSADSHLVDLLTRRERQILEELGTGLSNRSVAAKLEISTKTLQNHLTTIYRKLQVTDRSEALALLEQ